MDPISSLPEVRINIASETQPLMSQRNGILHRFSLMPASEKGLTIALGAVSICSAVSAAGLFFTPDPSPLDIFVSPAIIAKNCRQWSLLICSLMTGLITGLVTSHFLQNPQSKNGMTPEIIDLIKKKIAQATPERSS